MTNVNHGGTETQRTHGDQRVWVQAVVGDLNRTQPAPLCAFFVSLCLLWLTSVIKRGGGWSCGGGFFGGLEGLRGEQVLVHRLSRSLTSRARIAW